MKVDSRSKSLWSLSTGVDFPWKPSLCSKAGGTEGPRGRGRGPEGQRGNCPPIFCPDRRKYLSYMLSSSPLPIYIRRPEELRGPRSQRVRGAGGQEARCLDARGNYCPYFVAMIRAKYSSPNDSPMAPPNVFIFRCACIELNKTYWATSCWKGNKYG